MNKVILIGYFKETAELCEKCDCIIVGYVDSEPKGPFEYLGNDEEFVKHYKEYIDTSLVVTPDNPNVREKIYNRYHNLGFNFQTLVSPDAVVSKSAKISEGCMIQSLCNISSDSYLGKCVRINTGANIMHDSHIEDYAVVAPDAVVLGHVSIGTRAYIGANCTILPYIKIGKESLVGAGAVVTKEVHEGTVVAGVPARVLPKKE